MSSRSIQDIIARRLEKDVLQTRLANALKTSCEDFLKTSSKRLEDVFGRRLERQKIVTLKTSSRRLQNVLENKKCLLGRRLIKA